MLSSTTLHFKQLKKSCEKTDVYETVITEIQNSVVPKIKECIAIVMDNIISNQNLSNISFALEVRTQKWYKDLIVECKDIYKTGYLLLLDVNAFIRSNAVCSIIAEIIKLKDQLDGSEALLDVYSILNSYSMANECVCVLQEVINMLTEKLEKHKDADTLSRLFLCYERLIEVSSNSIDGIDSAVDYMKVLVKYLEQYAKDFNSEDSFLYLISKAWNLGVDEYDNERDFNAKDLFLIAKSVVEISEKVVTASMNFIKLQSYISKW